MRSSKPNKVRKALFNSPSHIRSAAVSSTLSHDLREKYGVKSVRVRKDDSVKVMRGEYAGVEGKVTKVDADSETVTVEGVTREKIAGGTVPVEIHASKVLVTALNLGDKLRARRLEKSSKSPNE